MEENKRNQIKGGLWKATSKNGANYYRGSVALNGIEYWVSLFPNKNKLKEKSPDLNLILEAKNPEDMKVQKAVEKKEVEVAIPNFSVIEEDIPF